MTTILPATSRRNRSVPRRPRGPIRYAAARASGWCTTGDGPEGKTVDILVLSTIGCCWLQE
ncbi:Uncharacterised protein [Mycobacteroides abscessus subsp. abscessus]|nr:Uncharacterised protein [Mycobacteroides abscessus subsp. abscessus]